MLLSAAIICGCSALTRTPGNKTQLLLIYGPKKSLPKEGQSKELDRVEGRSKAALVVRNCGYFKFQNVSSGFTSSNPASQASWLRHTTSASALRPVSG